MATSRAARDAQVEQVYRFIKDWYDAKGETPTLKAICTGTGLTKHTVQDRIAFLQGAGRLTENSRVPTGAAALR